MTWRCPVCDKENDDSNEFCIVCLFEKSNVGKSSVPVNKLSQSEKEPNKEKVIISVGIPRGLLINDDKSSFFGYVLTKREEVIQLEKHTYAVWMQALRPQKMKDLSSMWQNDKVPLETLIDNMERAGLVVVFSGSVDDDYMKISKLIPIPIGMTWSSYEKDLDEVIIASAEGAEKVVLSPPAYIFWALCDYKSTISEIYNKIESAYKLEPNLLKITIVETFRLLMDTRVLFALNDTK